MRSTRERKKKSIRIHMLISLIWLDFVANDRRRYNKFTSNHFKVIIFVESPYDFRFYHRLKHSLSSSQNNHIKCFNTEYCFRDRAPHAFHQFCTIQEEK